MPETTRQPREASGRGPGRAHAEEGGQISVLLVLGLIPLVFLVALVFNTAHQTSRKMQMQGAADAAAVSGGVWVARGMNLMVLNNNGMVEVLSVMIVVRSLDQTLNVMGVVGPIIIGILARAAPATGPGAFAIAAIIVAIKIQLRAYSVLSRATSRLDALLGRVGWGVMRALDKLNQGVKVVIPPVALAQTVHYADMNGAGKFWFMLTGPRGADVRLPGGVRVPRLGGISLQNFMPMMPVARGPQRFLAVEADKCQVPKLRDAAAPLLIKYLPLYPLSAFVFDRLIARNVASLAGAGGGHRPGSLPWFLRRVLNDALRIIARSGMLNWPSNPPRPMLLEDRPNRSPSQGMNRSEEQVDLRRVRKYLQFLVLAGGQNDAASPVGGRRFANRTAVWLPETQLTYAQADVYNPTFWGMFHQDWRAKLARARLLEEKTDDLLSLPRVRALARFNDWSFVNNH
jgi:hypothetical protein